MSTKLEDGKYEFKHGNGDTRMYYVKGGMFSQNCTSHGDLLGERPLSEIQWKPLRRIADLDGRPVVDEAVIEKLIAELRGDMFGLIGSSLSEEWFSVRLRKHLCPSKQEADIASQIEVLKQKAKVERESGTWTGSMVYEKQIAALKAAQRGAVEAEREIPQPEKGDIKGICERLRVLREDRSKCIGDTVHWNAYTTDIRRTLENHLEAITDAILSAEAAPTTNRYLETATGEEWVLVAIDGDKWHWLQRSSDKRVFARLPDELAREFTPLSPAEADAPIVDLRKFGAFPCWRNDGELHTAWRVAVVANGFHNVTVRCKDGRTDLHTDEYFAANFTRTRPLTLPPEHEKLIQPIVAKFGMDAGELRDVIAKVAG